MVILDNLSGQTTERHKRNLYKNKCKRHLLPGGMTDELQLIDDGVGYALKHEMGALHDAWLMEEGNLELWTAEGKGFPAWKKRVLSSSPSSRRRLGRMSALDSTSRPLRNVWACG